MQDTKLYEQLLGIQKPWKVGSVRMDLAGQRIDVEVICEEKVNWADPVSGKRAHVHSWEKRSWRHLDTCQFATVITAEVPRVQYEDGSTEMVSVPWAEKRSKWSKLFERFAIEVLQCASSLKAGCALLRISWHEAHGIMKRAVERGMERRDLESLRYVGLDEKSFLRGQDYISLMTDIKGGRVLEVVPGNDTQSGVKLWESLPKNQRQEVWAAAMDMSGGFIKATEQAAPQADIVHDRFHIAKHLNEAVDLVRRKENKELLEQGDQTLKGTRFQWLFREESIPREKRRTFAELKQSGLKVARAWTIKELFDHFWSYHSAAHALRFFEKWYQWAVRCRLKPMVKVAKTLQRHILNLLTYIEHRISNAVTEGLNSKIQSIKSNARGFRSFDNYRTRILFYCGKLELYPD